MSGGSENCLKWVYADYFPLFTHITSKFDMLNSSTLAIQREDLLHQALCLYR